MIIKGKKELVRFAVGSIRKWELAEIANRTNIGDRVRYKASRDKVGETEHKVGKVIGKYPHFALVKVGAYREAILWVDMVRTSQTAELVNEES